MDHLHLPKIRTWCHSDTFQITVRNMCSIESGSNGFALLPRCHSAGGAIGSFVPCTTRARIEALSRRKREATYEPHVGFEHSAEETNSSRSLYESSGNPISLANKDIYYSAGHAFKEWRGHSVTSLVHGTLRQVNTVGARSRKSEEKYKSDACVSDL